ncbi:hypothetical protein DQ04_13631000 [Trypanosoma grayi]|uniref:hypothetical protein n=1 Tax=Trypanosoma grayi TaxID=71804 RepID=UPI0004F46B86|nr:hypothetical protein DQ04_13631000 [Trypanosoma grayi]KEG06498.1 hypothetical protein DQ04_13631000 [Trypanosoma grayi]
MVAPQDADEIRLATMYNALACPDPGNNPFHLGLLRRIGDMEEEEQTYKEKLSAHSWLFSDQTSGATNALPPKKKKVGFAEKVAKSRIGADICAQFMSGRCNYGSRCRYIHPDKTAALQNAIAATQYMMSQELEGDSKSVKSFASSIGAGSRVRLQSRLRPVNFSLKQRELIPAGEKPRDIDSNSDTDDDYKLEAAWRRAVWMLCGSVMACSVVVAVIY